MKIQMGDFGSFTVSFHPRTEGEFEDPEIRWFPPADPYMKAFRA